MQKLIGCFWNAQRTGHMDFSRRRKICGKLENGKEKWKWHLQLARWRKLGRRLGKKKKLNKKKKLKYNCFLFHSMIEYNHKRDPRISNHLFKTNN